MAKSKSYRHAHFGTVVRTDADPKVLSNDWIPVDLESEDLIGGEEEKSDDKSGDSGERGNVTREESHSKRGGARSGAARKG